MRFFAVLGLLVMSGTVDAANVRTTLRANQDGVYSTAYPCVRADRSDCAPPTTATLTCDDSTAESLVGLVTGNAYSANVRQSFAGSAAATATLSVVTVSGDDATSEGWAISSAGAGNNLTHNGTGTGAGALKVRGTTGGNSVDCSVRAWSYVDAPASDATAPTVPTGLTTTAVSGGVQLEWDASSDPFVGGESGSGVDEYDIRLGSTVVQTVTTGVSPSTTPLLTGFSIGTVTNTSANQAGTNWTLTARGAGYTSTADNGYFLAAQFSGDVTVTAKIASFSSALDFGHCGPMIRETTGQGSKHGFIFQSTDEINIGVKAKARTADSTSAASLGTQGNISAPVWLKAARSGDTISYSYSLDGNAFTALASGTVSMASTVYAGIALASQDTNTTVTCEVEQLSIVTVPRLSYTYTTATIGSYSIRARDAANNNSSYGAGVTGTPNVSAPQVKWHPGHYVRLDANTTATISAADLSAVNSNAAIKGAEIQYPWTVLETARGVYDFSRINGHLSQLNGKKLIIHLVDRNFSGSSATGTLPAYLATESGGGGGWYAKSGGGVVAKLWLSAIMDRWIALSNALAAQYDTDARVEMILILKESSPDITQAENAATCSPAGQNCYSRSAWAAQYIRAAQAAPLAWPHTNRVARSNFLSGQISGMLAGYNAAIVGHGGPDVPPPDHAETIAGQVWRGIATDPSGGTPISYIGTAPCGYVSASTPYTTNGAKDCKDPSGTCVGFTATELFNHAYNTLQVTHLSWVRRETGTAPWTTGILPVIQANPNMRTSCPALYSGNCDTN